MPFPNGRHHRRADPRPARLLGAGGPGAARARAAHRHRGHRTAAGAAARPGRRPRLVRHRRFVVFSFESTVRADAVIGASI